MSKGEFTYHSDDGFVAIGYQFPSGTVILEWIPETTPDDMMMIDGHHRSVYESWEDFRTVCQGEIS